MRRFSLVTLNVGLLTGVAFAIVGCGLRFEAPPLEVFKRPSLVGAGTIVQIKSTTNEELSDIEVKISAEDRQFTHVEMRLGAYETVEIGWKKLGGWQVPESAKIEVRARGYFLPVRARLEKTEEPVDETSANGV